MYLLYQSEFSKNSSLNFTGMQLKVASKNKVMYNIGHSSSCQNRPYGEDTIDTCAHILEGEIIGNTTVTLFHAGM